MVLGLRKDPLTGFRFRVEIDGIISTAFSDVSGLSVEIEMEDYREGGVNDYVHKFPKFTKSQGIVLKRGICDGDELWNWHQDVVHGNIARKNGSIILLDSFGAEQWRWNFYQGFPVKWTGPDFKADANGIAFEAIEIVHKGIKKA